MPFFLYEGHSLRYTEHGEGPALLFLHAGPMSSEMFRPLLPLYQGRFHCIFLDFLGYGQSDHSPAPPADLYMDQARQILALLEHLDLKLVHLLGIDGGAAAALGTAALAPERVASVIADGLEGPCSTQKADALRLQRAALKLNDSAAVLWRRMHGLRWEAVVDWDTEATVRHLEAGGRLIPRDLSRCTRPVLFTALRTDNVYPQAEENAIALAEALPRGRAYIFTQGLHPAVLSNAREFAEVVAAFVGL